MKNLARNHLIHWCALAVGCATIIGFVAYRVVSGSKGVSASDAAGESFESHVEKCTRIPNFADFVWMTRASDKSIGELLEKEAVDFFPLKC